MPVQVANYPQHLPNFTTKQDLRDVVYAADMNQVQLEVAAIAQIIGTLPTGPYDTLKDRFAAVEEAVTAVAEHFNGSGLLPEAGVQGLTTDLTTLQTDLTTLQTAVANLQTAVANLHGLIDNSNDTHTSATNSLQQQITNLFNKVLGDEAVLANRTLSNTWTAPQLFPSLSGVWGDESGVSEPVLVLGTSSGYHFGIRSYNGALEFVVVYNDANPDAVLSDANPFITASAIFGIGKDGTLNVATSATPLENVTYTDVSTFGSAWRGDSGVFLQLVKSIDGVVHLNCHSLQYSGSGSDGSTHNIKTLPNWAQPTHVVYGCATSASKNQQTGFIINPDGTMYIDHPLGNDDSGSALTWAFHACYYAGGA